MEDMYCNGFRTIYELVNFTERNIEKPGDISNKAGIAFLAG